MAYDIGNTIYEPFEHYIAAYAKYAYAHIQHTIRAGDDAIDYIGKQAAFQLTIHSSDRDAKQLPHTPVAIIVRFSRRAELP